MRIYWTSATDFASIRIWTSTRSHLKRDASGNHSTLKNGTLCSQEILWLYPSTERSYASSTRHQVKPRQLQLHCRPLFQGLPEDQDLCNRYHRLCHPATRTKPSQPRLPALHWTQASPPESKERRARGYRNFPGSSAPSSARTSDHP